MLARHSNKPKWIGVGGADCSRSARSRRMRIMPDIATADAPSDGVSTLKGDDNMATTPGRHFAESPSARGRVQTIILAVLVVLAVGAGGFALGRTTAPDAKSTTSTVTTGGTVSGASGTTVNDPHRAPPRGCRRRRAP